MVAGDAVLDGGTFREEVSVSGVVEEALSKLVKGFKASCGQA